MNVWILTIGSSDVQLKTKDNWQKLFRSARSQVDGRGFSPSKEPVEGRFLADSRVLGVVYSQPQAEQHFNDLAFPLIDNFIGQIKDKLVDRIILVLSDQSIFSKAERTSQRHPYWQDTYTLQPILEKHLRHGLMDDLPNLSIQPVFLKPKSSEKGLDNWDSVLKLVQDEFSKLDVPNKADIYVSHQASTPAVSSAVQFTSLANFGDRVKFLVSNEYNPELTDILPSSNYLIALKRQQAEKLLEQHSYFAVKEIYSSHLSAEENTLLDAAIQWNFAEFGNFADQIESLTGLSKFHYLVEEVKERRQQWWWEAYEASYLGVIRLDQKNTVEAFFHTFRAFEGLVTKWSTIAYPDDIDDRNGQSVAILKDESTLPQLLLKDLEELKEADKLPEIKLYGERLFELFRVTKPHLSDNEDLKPVWKKARDIRNQQFHRLKGLDASSLYKAWGMNSRSSWEGRVLNCLKLISEQPHFKSLAKASLMSKVHRELKKAIAKL